VLGSVAGWMGAGLPDRIRREISAVRRAGRRRAPGRATLAAGPVSMAQTASPSSRMKPSEYLTFERTSEQKHEYLRGRVFAMAGASPKHNLVCGI
jgi:hypothetical protein